LLLLLLLCLGQRWSTLLLLLDRVHLVERHSGATHFRPGSESRLGSEPSDTGNRLGPV
jgi:hypothetical protein